ncbi:phosphodiester glycosidase family protein [Dysgonomonas gadei]|uniref:phosphodiester glycosidase family protein n=1 Tax=Dysgonomonas gadei TaxID=156974 RepID=UPI003AF05EBA
MTDNKKKITALNPTFSNKGVISKCSTSAQEGGSSHTTGKSFLGVMYDGISKKLYLDGKAMSGTSDPKFIIPYLQYYPCFCVKTDGTATIRWSATPADYANMLPFCDAIVASLNPLVYNSKNIFETDVIEPNTGLHIINTKNYKDPNCLWLEVATTDTKRNRTFFGHKSDGSYLQVLSNHSSMNLKTGAKLMMDLGCDYAVNMDGDSGMKLWVKSGYGVSSDFTSSGGATYLGAITCAYIK